MSKFIHFSSNVTKITLPTEFAYLHNYTPHEISQVAATELQQYLKNQTDFIHDFGIKNLNRLDSYGKMFGVLVVKNSKGNLGYISAFSGKLAGTTQHKHFVPPIFDILDSNGFYRKSETEVNHINIQIENILVNEEYILLKKNFEEKQLLHQSLLFQEQQKIKQQRKLRKTQQQTNNQLNINEEFYLKEYEIYLNNKIYPLQEKYEKIHFELIELKRLRKEKSAWGQQEIFKHYKFLNTKGETKNLLDIFDSSEQNIPAGAGDCCAPKLFQYAFLNNLTPIALSEFWWGKPLTTSVRKHGYFYPACTGKCKPILEHMLLGLQVAKNPLLKELQTEKELEIIYNDNYIIIVNKPPELLSVRGKEIDDSVYTRIKKQFPKATGPLIVHRIDMSTSGILLIAKNKDIHKSLQKQFLDKTIQKRYVALLDGVPNETSGTINLPIRVDLDDRPKQLVCYEHGKPALTKWETIEVMGNQTKVNFYPITGRTHQLRLHAAHSLGLNTPIVGDDLYGKKENRLHLHAEKIGFTHPITQKWMEFIVKPKF